MIVAMIARVSIDEAKGFTFTFPRGKSCRRTHQIKNKIKQHKTNKKMTKHAPDNEK